MLKREELEAAKCWEAIDAVKGDAAMTEFRRQARFHQAVWRQRAGHPIGTHPIRGGSKARPLGSRLELEYARETGANFLTPAILRAVHHRLSYKEPDEMPYETRLMADLLSSMPMCFNLFGEMREDHNEAKNLARLLWPNADGAFDEIKFEWSPARCDPLYLGNKSAFDVAILLSSADSKSGVIGVETKYHESLPAPKDCGQRLERYIEVSERSQAFARGALDQLVESDLQQIWLDHLLLLSMLQHPSEQWSLGRFVLIYPEKNAAYADAARRYRDLLVEDNTYSAMTIEALLRNGALRPELRAAFARRYFW